MSNIEQGISNVEVWLFYYYELLLAVEILLTNMEIN